jgi:hypothetical protein
LARSKPQLIAENKALKAQLRANNISRVLRDLIKYGGYVGISNFVYKSIAALSGKVTIADLGLKVDGDFVTVECKFAIITGLTVGGIGLIVGLLGAIYGRSQRKLRQDVIESKSTRIRELEALIDPSRSTSNLTVRGDTRKEDR